MTKLTIRSFILPQPELPLALAAREIPPDMNLLAAFANEILKDRKHLAASP